jgi:hypothetical protein
VNLRLKQARWFCEVGSAVVKWEIKVRYFDLPNEPFREGKMKMSTALNKVTVYLTDEEYAAMKAEAEDEGVTVSAILRAKLGLTYKRRGAPAGNANRRTAARASHESERKDN